LEQLLWFATNLLGDSDRSQVDSLERKVDKLIGLVLHEWHSQFTCGVWIVLSWCLSVMAMGLQFMRQADYDVFNCFTVLHYKELCEKVFAPVAGDSEYNELERQKVRPDIMAMVHNIIKDAPDDQISYITSQQHLQQLAYELLVEFNMKNVAHCLRFFGNLFTVNEQLCSHYVQ
jgi:hypothetical protein